MSDASNFNRWFIVTVALVVGFLIGVAFAVYLVYAWVPANVILRDSPPKFLRFDPSGQTAEYRDLYVARAANRFVAGGQTDISLQDAQAALGVTTGDATPMEALSMARSAEQAARVENAAEPDPNAGRFTLLDQSNLQALADRLDQVKDQPPVVPQNVLDARRNAAIYGLLLLLLWIALLGGILLLVANWLGLNQPVVYVPAPQEPIDVSRSVSGAAVAATTIAGLDNIPEPAYGAAVVAPTEPGVEDIVLQPPTSMRAASPLDGESQLAHFTLIYKHGDALDAMDRDIRDKSDKWVAVCGVSTDEILGVESPPRVVGLGVWVLDKGAMSSNKKILLTPYAYHNAVLNEKSKSKPGVMDVLQARTGMRFEVLVADVRAEVMVVDAQFLPAGNEPEAYFGSLELEFYVFSNSNV